MRANNFTELNRTTRTVRCTNTRQTAWAAREDSYEVAVITVSGTIFGRTVTLTAEALVPDDGRPIERITTTTSHFTGRYGRCGIKNFPATMTFWRNQDGTWRADTRFYYRNTNTGHIVGWADEFPWNGQN